MSARIPISAAIPPPAFRRTDVTWCSAEQLKHIFSKLVFFGGLAAIGILTVPAAMLFGMIALIRAMTDLITNKLDK